MTEMVMVRVYILEAEKLVQPILSYLHDTAKVRGVTVFRGITGFGKSGQAHSSGLLDLSLNLPVAIEFFDEQSRIDEIIKYLQSIVEAGHITYWPIQVA
jgi:PII-like signaling protein